MSVVVVVFVFLQKQTNKFTLSINLHPDHTQTPNMSVSTVETVNNDASAQPRQNSKTVECRLKLTYQKLAAVEAKIYM